MAIRKLKKRNYLGLGYIHTFRNDTTGEIVTVPCTEQEYTRLGEKGGEKYNPTLAGHTWDGSAGGTYKVDTPNSILGEDEYCVIGNKKMVTLKDEDGSSKFQTLAVDAIDENDNLDEEKLEVKLKVR
jgi:hypothetical protein